MKRLLLCLSLVLLMTVFSIYAFYNCKATAEEIKQNIESVSENFRKEDFDTALQKADNAINLWHKLSDRTIFVEDVQNDIEIEMTLARISEMTRQKSDDIYAECRVLYSLLDSFIDKQMPRLANVF